MPEENKKPLRVTFSNEITPEDNRARQVTLSILTGGKPVYIHKKTIASDTYKKFFSHLLYEPLSSPV